MYPPLHPISPHLAAGKHLGTITLVTISNHLWNYQEYKLEICIVMSHHISTVTGCPATLPQPLPCTTLHHLSCEIKKEGLSHMGLGPGNAAALLQYTVWAIIGDCKQCIAKCSIAALLSDTIALVLWDPRHWWFLHPLQQQLVPTALVHVCITPTTGGLNSIHPCPTYMHQNVHNKEQT